MKSFSRSVVAALALLPLGCGQETSEKEAEQAARPGKGISFKTFSERVKPVHLPIRLNCDEEINGTMPDLPDSMDTRFGKENATIFGKLAETDEFTAILYLVPAATSLPVIQTTDKDGNRISELALYEHWCGGSETSWGISWAVIAKDLTITIKDSSIRFQRNAAGQIIDSTRRTEVKETVFNIDESGIINETKSTVKQYPPGSSVN